MHLLLLIPDGVGMRNFLYTDFLQKQLEKGHRVTVWAPQHLLEQVQDNRVELLALPAIKPTTPYIEALRKAWQTVLLRWQAKHFQDPVYLRYIFPAKVNSIKNILKWLWDAWLQWGNVSPKGAQKLRSSYLKKSRETAYFRACQEQLEQLKPDIVFCTHQRASTAIAPMLAARSLGIPGSCFIFSWDNLPKATLFVETDHYLVWSEHMLQEMQQYHPEVSPDRVQIGGTPQFQPYFDETLYESRESFCQRHHLDPTKQFICFTGDDFTTSPHDPFYLEHLAEAVLQLNQASGDTYRILFRRCPVDWSDRYDVVLDKYRSLIQVVDPVWAPVSSDTSWNQFVPTREDVALLVNTVRHAALTINIGSTTALDFAALGKPACYFRYNAVENSRWDILKVYRYVHFRSMQGLEPVYWVNAQSELASVLQKALTDEAGCVAQAQAWHRRLAQHPLDTASERMAEILEKLAHARLLPEH